MAQAVRVLPGPRGLGTKQLTKSYGTVFHRGPDRIPWPSHFAQISDGFSSRFGRRRPFVLVGCILYALCLIATWLSTGMCQPILLNETCFIPLINPCIPMPVSKVALQKSMLLQSAGLPRPYAVRLPASRLEILAHGLAVFTSCSSSPIRHLARSYGFLGRT